MDAREIENGIKAATDSVRNVGDDLYGYYLTLRGPAPEAMPTGSVATLTYDQRTYHEIICEQVLGWVCYNHPLTPSDVDAYELVPDEYNFFPEYSQYVVEVKKLVRDASGKKRIATEYVEKPEGGRFTTIYRGVAQKVADAINDAALDTNSRDSLTRATVKRLDD